MKTIKIIASQLNNQFCEIPATTEDISGRIRSLKKDGSFIDGRMPLESEEPELWKFALTTKERLDKNNTRLCSTIYVPEKGVDIIDNKGKQMIGLYEFLSNHQYCSYVKDVVDGGTTKKKQINANFKRNHLLSFEILDETAKEEQLFENSRVETKYRAVIDNLYDEDKSGLKSGGEGFLEMCYGMGIYKPERNTKRQNYNLLINILSINPVNFKLYWEDADRLMVNTIRKGEKTDNPNTGEPYITSNETGLSFFNGVAIGRGIDEMKLHFRQNEKEYEWLMQVVSDKKAEEPKDISDKVEKTEKPYIPSEPRPELAGASDKVSREFGIINREIGMILSLMKRAHNNSNEEQKTKIRQRIEDGRVKFAKNLDYFNNQLNETARNKGIGL